MRNLPTAQLLDRLDRDWPVDPLADPLMTRIFDTHSLKAVSGILQACASFGELTGLSPQSRDLPPKLLAELDAYFEDVNASRLPAWADETRLDCGFAFCREHQSTIYLALGGASLPECYLSRDIAAVLGATHEFEDHMHRRVVETLQFMIVVMAPGSLTGETRSGLLMIHKIRLLHAAVRHLVRFRNDAEPFDPGHQLGKRLIAGDHLATSPINQCAMALTLQTFCYVILRSLTRLGVAMSVREQNAYVHVWSVVGHLLGVRDDLLPDDIDQARDLFELLKRRQRAETAQGKELERSLLRFAESVLPWYLRTIPRQLTFDLMSAGDCDLLGMGKQSAMTSAWNRVPLLIAHLLNLHLRGPAAGPPRSSHASEHVARLLLNGIAGLYRSDQGRAFVLPEHLKS